MEETFLKILQTNEIIFFPLFYNIHSFTKSQAIEKYDECFSSYNLPFKGKCGYVSKEQIYNIMRMYSLFRNK